MHAPRGKIDEFINYWIYFSNLIMSGFIAQFYQFMSFIEIYNLSHFGFCNLYQIPKFK